MERSEYKNIFENEETHFYYVSLHELILGLVRKFCVVSSPKILDAGCGTGGLLKKMDGVGVSGGIDSSEKAVFFSRKRGLDVRMARITKMPFTNGAFDLVTCIDVLYHRQVDDVEAIRECYRVLKKGGWLILRVPADMRLFSTHDRHVHTARRYERGEILEKLKNVGFLIRFVSSTQMIFYPISRLRVALENIGGRTQSSGVGKVNGVINWLMLTVLRLENWLIIQGLELPFGQGLIVVARR